MAHECSKFRFAESGQFNTRFPCGRNSDRRFEFPPAVRVDADGFLSTADAHIKLLARTGNKRISALRHQDIADAFALRRVRSLAVAEREMPVPGVQHRARVQDDFSSAAESRDSEHVAVVQAPPVIALPVARNPNPVPASHLDLPFLIDLESRRLLQWQRELAMLVLNQHVTFFVPASDAE